MRRILHILLTLLALLTAFLVVQLTVGRRTSPLMELYDAYADSPGVGTTILSDYPVDDTLAVDMLMLTATDSAGWHWMTQEFHLPALPPEVEELLDRGRIDPLEFRLAQIQHPDTALTLETGSLRSEFLTGKVDKVALVVTRRRQHMVSIVLIDSYDKFLAITDKKIKETY